MDAIVVEFEFYPHDENNKSIQVFYCYIIVR